MENWLISIADIRARIGKNGARFTFPVRHGSMRAGLFAPRGVDVQQPHTQDELYIITQGTSDFINGSERKPVKPGDILFVAAGAPHRFEDFSDDFETWVIFWGPEGGEAQ